MKILDLTSHTEASLPSGLRFEAWIVPNFKGANNLVDILKTKAYQPHDVYDLMLDKHPVQGITVQGYCMGRRNTDGTYAVALSPFGPLEVKATYEVEGVICVESQEGLCYVLRPPQKN